MSGFSPRRLSVALFLLSSALPLLAATPAARYETRMVYDKATHHGILFGGITATDSGTKQAYALADTWLWTGSRWVQLFPAHSPVARSGEVFVLDTLRDRAVLFGGHTTNTEVNDTWYFSGNDWTEINTPNAPPIRFLAGATYDPLRDRMVIFGGTQTHIDKNNVVTTTSLYDTWEFDGTTWRQIGGEGPHVSKPTLVYDEAHSQTLMMGIDDKGAALMYGYDAAAGTWTQLKPATMPSCVNEGFLVYDSVHEKTLFASGVCTGATAADNETLEWDGTNWTKLTAPLNAIRVFGAAYAFDADRGTIVQFGGTPAGGTPWSTTYIFARDAGWIAIADGQMPGPRSLFTFTSDPVHNTIWLFGGIDENGSTLSDFWKFQNGIWTQVTTDSDSSGPGDCGTPNAAFDTDRQKLVVVCSASDVHEFDGEKWTSVSSLKTVPTARRFSSMVYDQTLKKIVLFGGIDTNGSYLDQTWTWDGTAWTRVKSNPAPSRDLTQMWWDSTLKKTVIYGGLGRVTSTDRLSRFDDMWTFDGSGWTQLKPSNGTPGARYGAPMTVDPRTGHVIVFGGMRTDAAPPVPPSTLPGQVQLYANDQWEWDGTNWTKVVTDGVPPARENAGLAYDPTLNVFVMYGGWAGRYLSDLWTLNGNVWRPRAEPTGSRRRAVSVP
jgi:hypothetical protein